MQTPSHLIISAAVGQKLDRTTIPFYLKVFLLGSVLDASNAAVSPRFWNSRQGTFEGFAHWNMRASRIVGDLFLGIQFEKVSVGDLMARYYELD